MLVAIDSKIPDVIFDLRYRTDDNVAGKPLYDADFECRLDNKALDALTAAAYELRKQSMRLVIWDAYRTVEAQTILQKVNSNPKYVSTNSYHPRGLAVDLTLADETGHQLDMGTDFDEFSEKAHSDYENLNAHQLKNRQILRQAMETAGFNQWPYEWWHYNFGE